MLTEKKLSQCIGATVSKVVESAWNKHIAIVFTDGTFAVITARVDFDGDSEVEEGTFYRWEFTTDDIVESGVMTQEELDEVEAKEEAARLAANEVIDRRKYEELKKRFEPI